MTRQDLAAYLPLLRQNEMLSLSCTVSSDVVSIYEGSSVVSPNAHILFDLPEPSPDQAFCAIVFDFAIEFQEYPLTVIAGAVPEAVTASVYFPYQDNFVGTLMIVPLGTVLFMFVASEGHTIRQQIAELPDGDLSRVHLLGLAPATAGQITLASGRVVIARGHASFSSLL
jgi:hypothetical protein